MRNIEAGPPWLADAAEALGRKGQALNWNQVLQEVREQRAARLELLDLLLRVYRAYGEPAAGRPSGAVLPDVERTLRQAGVL